MFELTDELLLDHFGERTYQRGAKYAASGYVGDIAVHRQAGYIDLSAPVYNGRYTHYQTGLMVYPEANDLEGYCSCPVGYNCKHALALALVWREQHKPYEPEQWLEELLSVTAPSGVDQVQTQAEAGPLFFV